MRLLLIALFLSIAAPHAVGQFATPQETVAEMFDALNQEDFGRAARTLHPEALADLKRFFVKVETVAPNEEYGLPEGQSFSTMSPHEIYEWLLVTFMYAEMREEGVTLRVTYEYMGHEEEGDFIRAEVLTHTTVHGFEMSQTQIITLKRYKDGWFAMLSGDVDVMLRMLMNTPLDE